MKAKNIMKTALLLLLFVVLLSLSVVSHAEDNDCEFDIEKYVNKAKDYLYNNPNSDALRYSKRFLGNNWKVEINIDNEVWHIIHSKDNVYEVGKGSLKKKDFAVYTTMCTLHDIEKRDLTLKEAIKDKKIYYKPYGFRNRLKARLANLFF